MLRMSRLLTNVWCALVVMIVVGTQVSHGDPIVGKQWSIGSMWNGDKVTTHDPFRVYMEPLDEDGYVKVTVCGKFYNDPPPPAPPGPTDNIWLYEVVELFFLVSSDENYLKLALNPCGNHLVALLQGRQNRIEAMLPLNFTAVVSDDRTTWRGEAFVPLSYFPPGVDRFNAMYTHNMTDRQFEQVYPQKTPLLTRASFHRLQDMEIIDFDSIVPKSEQLTEYSEVWTNKMRTFREYKARKLWKGGPTQILPPPMKLRVHQLDNENMVKIIASGLLFDDPAPSSPPGPLEDLYNYEVVELFTLNSADETYLRVELGP